MAPENVLFAEQLGITRFAIIVYIIMLVVAMTAAGILYSQVAVKDGVLSQIRQKADYDQLTNVLNKQSFRDLVDTKLAHAGEGTKHICMMLDMDNFKLVNDTYGHQEGDRLPGGWMHFWMHFISSLIHTMNRAKSHFQQESV